MKIVVEFESIDEFNEFVQWKSERSSKADNASKTPINTSGIDGLTRNILKENGIKFIEDAQALTDSQLLSFTRFGKACLAHLRAWKKPESAPPG